jgi:pimeloyl-ACP methyl ester carboxylesterase
MAHNVVLDHQRQGDAGAPAVLLITGLGSQRISWPPELLSSLVERGLQVVTLDNRDAGRSTWLVDRPVPRANLIDMTRTGRGLPYRLSDMAEDVAHLADDLRLPRFHVVGASMGGMIGQHLAARHPTRVDSLCLLMTTAQTPRPDAADAAAWETLLTPPPAERSAFIDHLVSAARTLGDPLDFDEDRLRRRAIEHFERGYDPAAYLRQLLATLADDDRSELVRSLEVRTLVLHGNEDAVIPVEQGESLAGLIPGARLRIIDGMRHELAPRLAPLLAGEIASHILRPEDQ